MKKAKIEQPYIGPFSLREAKEIEKDFKQISKKQFLELKGQEVENTILGAFIVERKDAQQYNVFLLIS